MSKFRISALAFALLAAGCTPMYWTKPGVTAAETGEALAECRSAARREARYSDFFYGGLHSSWHFGYGLMRDPWGRVFQAWPYYPYHHTFYDPFYGRLQEEQRLERFCMRARGFELAPAQQAANQPP